MAMNRAQVESSFIITKEALDVAGCVTYWRCGVSVSIEALTKAWTEAGLDPELLRKAPEPATALRRAVMDQQERHRLVRGIGKGQWAIVDERVVEVEGQPPLPPTYSTVAIVQAETLTGKFTPVVKYQEGYDESTQLGERIFSAFGNQLGLYDPSDITSWFVKLAYANNAITLRESGGVYFIPKPSMDFWQKAAEVVEKVSGQQIAVFRIPAMKNAEAVQAITAAMTAEAEALTAAMEAELLATGDEAIGKRALASRSQQAQALLDKVGAYEQLLGLQLGVRDKVEKLQANLALASMTDVESGA